MMELMKHLRLI